MAGVLIRLTEDGPLGKAGSEVWVNDPKDAEASHAARKPAPKKPEKS